MNLNNPGRRRIMANRMVINKAIKHYHEEFPDDPQNVEVDKTKSISELSNKELSNMIYRLRTERDAQQIIRELKRNSGERDTYENPFKVDTKTPINQLYHHGIMGMKWGVRRYQNPDGTRTATGKRRERNSQQSQKTENKKKGIEGMTNDDLRKLNERLRLEEDYKRLTRLQVKKGESWVKKSISSAGEQALTDFSKAVMLGSAKLLVKKLSPSFAEAAFKIKDKKND